MILIIRNGLRRRIDFLLKLLRYIITLYNRYGTLKSNDVIGLLGRWGVCKKIIVNLLIIYNNLITINSYKRKKALLDCIIISNIY